MQFNCNFVLCLSVIPLLLLGAALAEDETAEDWDWEQKINPARWSLLADEPEDHWYNWDKTEIVRIRTGYRNYEQRQMDEFLKTLPEPTAGSSFEGRSFPSIAASVATCGTAVTFQIKNYLNESLFGAQELQSGELGPGLAEIQAKTKEIVVVKDESNNPHARLKYTVGNTTVLFRMQFLMQGNHTRMALVAGNSSPLYPSTSATSEPIFPVDLTNVEEKFQLAMYQNQYNHELVRNYKIFYVRMTSRLALPRRLAITVEIFRYFH